MVQTRSRRGFHHFSVRSLDVFIPGKGKFPLTLMKSLLICRIRWEAGGYDSLCSSNVNKSSYPPQHMHLKMARCFSGFASASEGCSRHAHMQSVNDCHRVSCWELFPGISSMI